MVEVNMNMEVNMEEVDMEEVNMAVNMVCKQIGIESNGKERRVRRGREHGNSLIAGWLQANPFLGGANKSWRSVPPHHKRGNGAVDERWPFCMAQ
jgi:hypothetical protein